MSSPAQVCRTAARWLLGGFLILAGVGHLTFARDQFPAQVPEWLPLNTDLVVLGSGLVEIGLGSALAAAGAHRHQVGWVVAAFLVAVFPGNLHQYLAGNDAFGLNSDRARLIRLFFQPLLVLWALWACGSMQRRATRPRAARSD